MPTNKAYLLFLKRSKYQRDKERAMRNLVRFEGLGANSQLVGTLKGLVRWSKLGNLRYTHLGRLP
jgi:hypothetical protein